METLKLINKTGYLYTHHTSSDIWWFSRIYGCGFTALENLWIEANQFTGNTPLTFSFSEDSLFKILGPTNEPVASLTTSDIHTLSNCYILPICINSEYEGELLDTLYIKDPQDNILTSIQIGVEMEDINPDLLVNLSNKGYELSTEEYRAMYEANSLSEEVDVSFMNDKYIQLLASYNVLLMNRGSYASLQGLLNWFGYPQGTLRMVKKWNIVNDIDKFIEVPLDYKNVATTNLINFVIETSSNDNFQYPLYTEMMRWKMFLLRLFMESLFIPIHLNVSQSTIRDISIKRPPIQTGTYIVTQFHDNLIMTGGKSVEPPKIVDVDEEEGEEEVKEGEDSVNNLKDNGSLIEKELQKLPNNKIPNKQSTPNLLKYNNPWYYISGYTEFGGATQAGSFETYLNATGKVGIYNKFKFSDNAIKPVSYETNDPDHTFINLNNKPSFIGWRCKWIDLIYSNGYKVRYDVQMDTSYLQSYLSKLRVEAYSPEVHPTFLNQEYTPSDYTIEHFTRRFGQDISTGDLVTIFKDIPEEYKICVYKNEDTIILSDRPMRYPYQKQLFLSHLVSETYDNNIPATFTNKMILITMRWVVDYNNIRGVWKVTNSRGITQTYHTQSILLYKPDNYSVIFQGTLDDIPLNVSYSVTIR